MNDLTGKTITIPADLWGYGVFALPDVAEKLNRDDYSLTASLLLNLHGAIEDQHPPRMDEPEGPAFVRAGTRRFANVSPSHEFTFARFERGGKWRDMGGAVYEWDDLIDPRPVD